MKTINVDLSRLSMNELVSRFEALKKLYHHVGYIGVYLWQPGGLCPLARMILIYSEYNAFMRHIKTYARINKLNCGGWFWPIGKIKPRKEWLEQEIERVYGAIVSLEKELNIYNKKKYE